MKTVELSELKEKVPLAGNEPLAVEHDGKLLGYFYPKPQKNQAEVDALWERLEKVVERVMEETGLDEEGLVETLAPNKSKP